jgi:tetratricopeptide (TPR) repeat protein
LLKARHLEEAEDWARRTLDRRPNEPDALANLAAIRNAGSKFAEAEALCRKALAIKSDHLPTLLTLGNSLRGRHQDAAAEAMFRTCIAAHPESSLARYNLSTTLLMRRNYVEGFALYESRFDAFAAEYAADSLLAPWLAHPRRWMGEPLIGKRIVVWAEQGYGDTIMMLRYLGILRSMSPAVLVAAVPQPLHRLVMSTGAVDDVVGLEHYGLIHEMDYSVAFMSLPAAFTGTTNDASFKKRYLRVPSELVQFWQRRLAGVEKPKIGVAWAGAKGLKDDAKRSLPKKMLIPLARGDVALVNLQKEVVRGEEPITLPSFEFMDECEDFLDTAALMESLDAIVSVDTAVAHLGGALGKRVWLLNRYNGDWRWGRDETTSSWYESVQILRQQRDELWEPLISSVAMNVANCERDVGRLKCGSQIPGITG